MQQAVYFQKSKVVQEEFKLIELTTVREYLVENLKNIINEVKEERRQLDDDCMIETFSLMIKVREATVDLIKAICVWQESFTSHIRPTLMECDYVIERMIKGIDFINGSNLRKIFNFQFFRGNVLLLPYPNPKTVEHVKVSSALAEQIRMFANPLEEEVVYAYQFLINCLPEDVYKKVTSLKDWLMSAWVPRIWIADAVKHIKKRAARGALIETGRTASAPKLNVSANVNEEGDEISEGGDSPTKLTPSENKAKILQQLRSKISDKKLLRGNSGGILAPEEANKARKASVKMMKRLRRNQLLAAEADKIKNMTAAAAKEEQERLEAEEQKALEENLKSINEEEKKELEQVDFYYKEMEKLFIPKFGRRAVQTFAITGFDGIDREETDFILPTSTNRMFYLAATTSMQAQIEKIVNAKDTTEASKRTDGNLVAKRNRIIADRNQTIKDNKDYSNVDKNAAILGSNKDSTLTSEAGTEDGKENEEEDEEADNQSQQSAAERSVEDSSVMGDSNFKGNLSSSALSLTEEDVKQQRPQVKKSTPTAAAAASTPKPGKPAGANTRRMSDLTVTFSEHGGDSVVGSEGNNTDTHTDKSGSTRKSPKKAPSAVGSTTPKSSRAGKQSPVSESSKLPPIKRLSSSSKLSSRTSLRSLNSAGSSRSDGGGGASPTNSNANSNYETNSNWSTSSPTNSRTSSKAALDLGVANKKKPFVKASLNMHMSTTALREQFQLTNIVTTKKKILNLG